MLFVTAAHLIAANYYVANNGKYANNGSIGSPWDVDKLNDTKLKPGDTVFFRGGTYKMSDPILIQSVNGTENAWITFKNYGSEKPVFDGINMPYTEEGDAIFALEFVSYVMVDGLHVKNSPMQGFSIWISEHVTIQNCFSDLSWKPGIGVWGDKVRMQWSSNIKVLNNEVKDPNSWDAPSRAGQDRPNAKWPPHESISIGRVRDFEVAYNLVYGGNKEGIDAKGPTTMASSTTTLFIARNGSLFI